MPFSELDASALGRSLAQIADRESDVVDLFLERKEVVEIGTDDAEPGILARREAGFALRLLRGDRTWIAARDGFEPEAFGQALREVARAVPPTQYRPPERIGGGFEGPLGADEVRAFPAAVDRYIRREHVAFPYRLGVRRHHRWIQVVGPRLLFEPEEETFYSVWAELPWTRYGTLLVELDEAAAEGTADALLRHFRGRPAEGGSASRARQRAAVLGPGAAAVLLHEAVAHALEADTLVLTGSPEAACGYRLGSELLNVLDDPAGAPAPVARDFDDEGVPVTRRWLLRKGEVREPLADLFFARSSKRLSPGAGRRATRHDLPAPRSSHLELAPGEASLEDLWEEGRGGVYLPEASRGRLDPVAGDFELAFPYGRLIGPDGPADYMGPCRIRGQVSQLLTAITAVGNEPRFAGAGWCAKGGHRLPVWATSPAVFVEGLEIES